MANTVLSVEQLTKVYNATPVVNAISFEVPRGEIFGILGPNGAGKTTTLEMIEAIVPMTSGKVLVDGTDVQKHPAAVKRKIGVQPQAAAFYDKVTLRELLVLFGALYGEKVDADALLHEVHLEEKANSFFERLSGGQKQRFSIIAALVHNPVILFLDEPTTGLDPQARRNLWDLVRDIRKKGITVVITTHYMDEAELLCDRVAIMDTGKIIALDPPQTLIQSLLDTGFTKEVRVQQASLDDVFIQLTGKELRE